MYGLMRRFFCGVRGHCITLRFEPNKLSLECACCGYQSDGWDLRVVYPTPEKANGPVELWGKDARGVEYLVAREVAVGQWERD